MTRDQRRSISVDCGRRSIEFVDTIDKTRFRIYDCNDSITITDVSYLVSILGNKVVLLSGYADDIDEVL